MRFFVFLCLCVIQYKTRKPDMNPDEKDLLRRNSRTHRPPCRRRTVPDAPSPLDLERRASKSTSASRNNAPPPVPAPPDPRGPSSLPSVPPRPTGHPAKTRPNWNSSPVPVWNSRGRARRRDPKGKRRTALLPRQHPPSQLSDEWPPFPRASTPICCRPGVRRSTTGSPSPFHHPLRTGTPLVPRLETTVCATRPSSSSAPWSGKTAT